MVNYQFEDNRFFTLITRPKDEAISLDSLLTKFGYKTLIYPMMEIEYIDCSEKLNKILDSGFQAIAVTSSNAVKSLSKNTSRKDIPLISVGKKTSATAMEYGFSDIRTAAGTADYLVQYIINNFHPRNGKIIHISGDHISVHISDILRKYEYETLRIISYKSVAIDRISNDLINILNGNNMNMILFFSKRTAEIFIKLVAPFNIDFHNILSFSLSKNISNVLSSIKWKNNITSDQPTQESLLEAIKRYISYNR